MAYWANDDPDAERGAGVDRCGPHRHAPRHAGLALQVQEQLERDPHCGDLYLFRGPEATWRRSFGTMALGYRCMRSGSTAESSSGRRRRGRRFDTRLGRWPTARRNRLVDSETDMEAERPAETKAEPRKRRKTWGQTDLGAPQITQFVISCVPWLPLPRPFPTTSPP